MKKLEVFIETPAGMNIDPIIERAFAIASKGTTFGNTKARFTYSTKTVSTASARIDGRWIITHGFTLDRVLIEADKLNGIIVGYFGLINAVAQFGKGKPNSCRPHTHFDMVWTDVEYSTEFKTYAKWITAEPDDIYNLEYEFDELDYDGIDFNVTDGRFDRHDDDADSLTVAAADDDTDDK